ncbi:hypothetical protein BDD12DRAFT_884620 [Trichophaea hybrida]|nr:hypothetical protein BDD12DRAFT_884620 [Trichophaea hybrida]
MKSVINDESNRPEKWVEMDFSITARIAEMDFSEYKTKKRVEMDFSMTTQEPVERVKAMDEKIIGKDHGRSVKSTKISTEMPTELPTEKQSTELPTEKQSTEMSTKKVTDAMFRTTSLRSIYKSMPIADDYRCVWYRTKITDIV